jgi:hypothetical protein
MKEKKKGGGTGIINRAINLRLGRIYVRSRTRRVEEETDCPIDDG